MPTTQPAGKPLKLLLLGGTGFLGPHTVWFAKGRGHELTLLNRGKTDPGLFPDLTLITGDREGDLAELEQAVTDGARWDAVIDFTAYVPAHVTRTCEILKDATQRYLVVSTVSVYGDFSNAPITEDAPLAQATPDQVAAVTKIREVGGLYGPLKALCETAAEAVMPWRVCNVRPTLIAGPGDSTDRFTWWPVTVRAVDTLPLPDGGTDPMQFIDARDLAAFLVTLAEQQTVGTFNACGNSTVGDVAHLCRDVTGAETQFTAVPTAKLLEAGVRPWADVPGWIPADSPMAGMATVDDDPARRVGLRNRPVTDTIAGAVEWFDAQGRDLRAGIKPEQIAAFLDKQ
ncbi:MAG: NAD-dependent epimerase/dehydratase family protein [Planctomycetota bacterium]